MSKTFKEKVEIAKRNEQLDLFIEYKEKYVVYDLFDLSFKLYLDICRELKIIDTKVEDDRYKSMVSNFNSYKLQTLIDGNISEVTLENYNQSQLKEHATMLARSALIYFSECLHHYSRSVPLGHILTQNS